jgi:uncharacterized protein YcfL
MINIMRKIVFALAISLVLFSCNSGESTAPVQDSTEVMVDTTVADTTVVDTTVVDTTVVDPLN